MATEPLSFDEVTALLRQTKDKTTALKTRPSEWLIEADRATLYKAITHDAEEVFLPNTGRNFSIKYVGDKVWLSPANGNFVPCGWYSIKALGYQVKDANVLASL